MEVTPACYTHLLSSLLSLAAGRVAVVLEGGYCLESLAEGAALTLRTLLGDPCPKMEPLSSPCDRFAFLNFLLINKFSTFPQQHSGHAHELHLRSTTALEKFVPSRRLQHCRAQQCQPTAKSTQSSARQFHWWRSVAG